MAIHILTTGATRGIGAACRAAFEARDDVLHWGAASADGDLSTAQGADRVWQAALERLDGRIDVLVNNAGIFEAQALDCEDWLAGWERTMAINLTASAQLCRHAVLAWQAAGTGGRIVNVGSRGGYRGEPRSTAYGASKAALHSLSQSLAQELAPHNIFVTAVAPGFVETGMASARLAGPQGDAIRAQSPLGRVARPEEVARTVLFLASPGSEFLTGAVVDINGASYLR